jgi:membrane protein
MQFKTKDTGLLLRMTFNEWNEKILLDKVQLLPFCIPGLLVLIISIAGYFFGNDTVNQNILDQISSAMGSETAMQVSQILIKSTESKSTIWGQ